MVEVGQSFRYHPDSGGHHVFNLNLALIIVSTFLVSLRLFTRKIVAKALGWDDFLAVVAWALCVAISALEMDTTNYGTGAQIEDVPRPTLLQFFKRLSIMELVYFLASGAVRLSILAFLPRLSKNIVDCMLVVLPLCVVTNYVKMGVKAIQILLVFSLGIFAVVTGMVRFSIIVTTDFSVNTTYKMLTVAVWTDAELHVGLWVGCFPALQPLLRHVTLMLGMRSQLDSTGAASRRNMMTSTATSNRKSVLDRWSRSPGHVRSKSTGSQPLENDAGQVEAVGGLSEDVEMVDLEKGEGAGQVGKQTDNSTPGKVRENPRAAERKSESSGRI
ncbi:hypothetical protein CSAL01_02099 [Colletotrichum salicis]|uniref:Rhodopsin domain-containing protein n=1 Tax=Colletotrichum salicis TaxID=1209931 RepID=A0A135V6D1_9PEZI|nr:hypothetical protein CSAL01_02099 [Colletotrichum salicis]